MMKLIICFQIQNFEGIDESRFKCQIFYNYLLILKNQIFLEFFRIPYGCIL